MGRGESSKSKNKPRGAAQASTDIKQASFSVDAA